MAPLAGVVTGVLTASPERGRWRLAVAIAWAASRWLFDTVALSCIMSGESVPVALAGRFGPAPGCMTSDDPNNLLALGVVGRNVVRVFAPWWWTSVGLLLPLVARGPTRPARPHVARPQSPCTTSRAATDARNAIQPSVTVYTASTVAEIESWPVRWPVEGYELLNPRTEPALRASTRRGGRRSAGVDDADPLGLADWPASAMAFSRAATVAASTVPVTLTPRSFWRASRAEVRASVHMPSTGPSQ